MNIDSRQPKCEMIIECFRLSLCDPEPCRLDAESGRAERAPGCRCFGYLGNDGRPLRLRPLSSDRKCRLRSECFGFCHPKWRLGQRDPPIGIQERRPRRESFGLFRDKCPSRCQSFAPRRENAHRDASTSHRAAKNAHRDATTSHRAAKNAHRDASTSHRATKSAHRDAARSHRHATIARRDVQCVALTDGSSAHGRKIGGG